MFLDLDSWLPTQILLFYQGRVQTTSPGDSDIVCIFFWTHYACVLVSQSCLTLCDPMDCSPPGSSDHGILQVRTLEWIVIPFSRGSFQPRDQTLVSCISGRFFTILQGTYHTYIYIYIYIYMYIYVCMCIYVCVYICMICYICCIYTCMYIHMGFPGGAMITNLSAVQEMQETQVRSLDWEDHLE